MKKLLLGFLLLSGLLGAAIVQAQVSFPTRNFDGTISSVPGVVLMCAGTGGIYVPCASLPTMPTTPATNSYLLLAGGGGYVLNASGGKIIIQ